MSWCYSCLYLSDGEGKWLLLLWELNIIPKKQFFFVCATQVIVLECKYYTVLEFPLAKANIWHHTFIFSLSTCSCWLSQLASHLQTLFKIMQFPPCFSNYIMILFPLLMFLRYYFRQRTKTYFKHTISFSSQVFHIFSYYTIGLI